MADHCHSCSIPLSAVGAQGPSDVYCQHCTDAQGNLRPRAEVEQGLASWIAEWQGVCPETAHKRAKQFMRAMPAWAEEE